MKRDVTVCSCTRLHDRRERADLPGTCFGTMCCAMRGRIGCTASRCGRGHDCTVYRVARSGTVCSEPGYGTVPALARCHDASLSQVDAQVVEGLDQVKWNEVGISDWLSARCAAGTMWHGRWCGTVWHDVLSSRMSRSLFWHRTMCMRTILARSKLLHDCTISGARSGTI